MDTLSKKEKKIAREIIEKGLLIEFGIALNDEDTVLKKWKDKEIMIRKNLWRITRE